jgi:hypothetical protein
MSEEVITDSDLEAMTHDTQVWRFGFCVCSDCEKDNDESKGEINE